MSDLNQKDELANSEYLEELSVINFGHDGGHSGGQGHEDGEGNWLVSYADMMTLLVGFFVILLSFASVDQQKFEGMRKALTVEFGGTYQTPFGDVHDRLREQFDKLGLGEMVAVRENSLGVEISFLGTIFFSTGSSDMKNEGRALLEQLVPVIHSEAAEFNIVVEGHTDDVPVSSNAFFRNNWELSSLRACRVLEEFLKNGGFDKQYMTAVGYGDSKPIVPNRDAQGIAIPDNQSQNRRVVIKLIKRQQAGLVPKSHELGSSPSN